jgi:hypothetical protein
VQPQQQQEATNDLNVKMLTKTKPLNKSASTEKWISLPANMNIDVNIDGIK